MSDKRIVFTAARLLDGESPARDGMTVVVEGNRIASVGDAPVETGESDRVIDLRGRTLMPGMVQGHFHACFGPCGVGLPGPVLGLDASPDVMLFEGLSQDRGKITELLSENGYRTAFFQSATQRFENRAQLTKNMGYDTFTPLEKMSKKGWATQV